MAVAGARRDRVNGSGSAVGRASASAIVLAALIAGGCDAFVAESTSASTTPSVNLRVPAAIARLRVPDPDALRVVVTLDERPLTVTVADAEGRRVTTFAVDELGEDGASGVLVARWFYDLGDDTVELARSVPLSVTPSSPRALVIDRYGTAFDADSDGRENLAELEAGSDPLVSDEPAASSGGTDCRFFRREGFPVPVDPPPPVRLSAVSRDSFAVEPESADEGVYYAAFVTDTVGSLIIEHTGGQPIDTDALLYRAPPAPPETTPDPDSALTLYDTRDQPPDGRRAIIPPPPTTSVFIEADVVYCYALVTRTPDAASSPAREALVDTVIELSFTPQPGRATRPRAPR